MKKYRFSVKDKLKFYICILPLRLRVFTDVRKGKWEIFLADLTWIINGIIKKRFSLPIFSDYYETNAGKFFIHRDLQSIITLSPAFEFQDRLYFKTLIQQDLKKRKKVLFIDIGAHVGLYTVELGNLFKGYKNFSIIAFEPNANNFFEENYQLLKKNIKLNKLKNVKIYNIGLGDRVSKKPNIFGIRTIPLDTVLSMRKISGYDSVFIKIDIEGYEREALKGAKKVIENSKKMTLLVEDCVDKRIVDFLNKQFSFIGKYTPYNSFWLREV